MEEMHRSGPGRILVELEAQHAELRKMMDRCEESIDELEQGRIDVADIARETARLRLAFTAHNTFEEQSLRPILLANDAFGVVRCDRMIEDHIAEHRELRERMQAATDSTSHLRDVIETLRAHLDAEERYLLTAKVLRSHAVGE